MILNIGDTYSKIVDVMNTRFGWNYKACFKGFYWVNKEIYYGAWFPKINKSVNGWINTMSADGKYIYMQNRTEPERMSEIDTAGIDRDKHITFVKFPDREYMYMGVYIRQNRDPKLGWIYERIAEDIDTDRI